MGLFGTLLPSSKRICRQLISSTLVVAIFVFLSGCGCDIHPTDADDGHEDIFIGSRADGSGALRTDFDFSVPIAVSPTVSLGDLVLYGSTDPGLNAVPIDLATNELFVLTLGTEVSIEITEISAGASMRFADTTLDEVGETYFLGAAPRIHFHPDWQLLLPSGETDGSISFKFTTPSPGYAESRVYVALLRVSQ